MIHYYTNTHLFTNLLIIKSSITKGYHKKDKTNSITKDRIGSGGSALGAFYAKIKECMNLREIVHERLLNVHKMNLYLCLVIC